MIVFPNAKINLGLNILSRREDGYHNISSCFLPIGWKDALEAIPSDQFIFSTSGLAISGKTDSNLCVKAFNLLKENHGISPVKMHLHKVIPMGAGLGGGSADGAFTLVLLNDLFDIGLGTKQLESYAKELGADCPFFIQNKPMMVSGIGEVLEPIDIKIRDLYMAVVFPNIHVNTALAFSKIIPEAPSVNIEEVIKKNSVEWKASLVNAFETPVFKEHGEIQTIKDQLYELGALYSAMTGSGSSVYGIFDHEPEMELVSNMFGDSDCWVGALPLL